jgi:hypothetical protein
LALRGSPFFLCVRHRTLLSTYDNQFDGFRHKHTGSNGLSKTVQQKTLCTV